MRPLSDLRILDLTTGPLAAIGRMLADLGAQVTDGRALLAGADIVVIEAGEPHSPSIEELAQTHPGLVILAVSPFGTTGPAAQWQATDPVLHALSGELARSGNPGQAPVLPPGELALDCAIAQAVYVMLVAYLQRRRTGLGDVLDFSLLEGASQALDPGFGITGSAALGIAASDLPRGRMEARHLYPIIKCADGHVRICVLAPRQWAGLFEWMGRPAAFADPSFAQMHVRYASPTLLPAIAGFFAPFSRAELEQAGQRHGVPIAAVLTLAEALRSEQLAARAALRPIELPSGLMAMAPDGLMEIDGVRMGAVDGPQRAAEWRPRLAAPPISPTTTRPLEGLRVLDFGVIVVGAEQGRLLADQGADVIKVESRAFPDGSRQSKGGGRMAQTFAAGHFNKRSLGINLRDPQGRALLLRLVEQSDVMLSNFKPGTLASLGLDPATLAALNPRLIMIDSSAYGPTGPWSRRLGYGPLVRACSGLTDQWREPGEADGFCDALTVYPDHVAARIGAIAALALLIRREATGRGGTASIAQNEVMLSHMAPSIARASAGLPAPLRDAPWGAFPCASDDEWCVVTIRGDADWQHLCTAIARPDLGADPALAAQEGRNSQRGRIDAALCGWLAHRTPLSAMQALQAHGVPAGAMLRVSELPDCAIFAERQAFRAVTHPSLAKPFLREAAPVRARRLPLPPDRPAPLLGEHTRAIAAERLHLSEAEIDALIEAGVLEVPQP